MVDMCRMAYSYEDEKKKCSIVIANVFTCESITVRYFYSFWYCVAVKIEAGKFGRMPRIPIHTQWSITIVLFLLLLLLLLLQMVLHLECQQKKTVLHFISFSNSLKKKQKRKKNSRNAFFWNEQLNWCYLNATNIWYACNPPPPFIPFWLTLWFGNSTDRIQKYKQKMWPLYSTHTKVNLCVLRDQFLLCRLY